MSHFEDAVSDYADVHAVRALLGQAYRIMEMHHKLFGDDTCNKMDNIVRDAWSLESAMMDAVYRLKEDPYEK